LETPGQSRRRTHEHEDRPTSASLAWYCRNSCGVQHIRVSYSV
jgi:hypothetical protein